MRFVFEKVFQVQIIPLQIINLEKPYATNCRKGSLNVFNSNSDVAYSKQACLLKCRNDYTMKTCGCTPPEFKGMNEIASQGLETQLILATQ